MPSPEVSPSLTTNVLHALLRCLKSHVNILQVLPPRIADDAFQLSHLLAAWKKAVDLNFLMLSKRAEDTDTLSFPGHDP